MQRLKERRDWLLLPVLIASPLFFIGGPDWLSAPVIREAWGQGHWVFFACLMFWWQGRWPLRAPHQWLALTLRINDATHDRNEGLFSDRYNGRLEVTPGWNHFRIPLEDIASAPETRRMNLARMIRLLLFTSGVTEPRWIYLDNLRLEPTE